jgi:hypothetical protein
VEGSRLEAAARVPIGNDRSRIGFAYRDKGGAHPGLRVADLSEPRALPSRKPTGNLARLRLEYPGPPPTSTA